MKIYIVRHGKTEFNDAGTMQGWMDSPLLPASLSLAEAAGEGFKAKGITFDKVYASDAPRAINTAKHIVKGMGVDHEINEQPLIKEMCFGSAEGQDVEHVWGVVARHFGYKDMDDLTSNLETNARCNLLHQYEEYSDAETLEVFHKRILKGFNEIVEENKDKDIENILVVSHGLTIIGLLQQLGWEGNSSRAFDNLSVSIVEVTDGHEVIEVNKSYILG